MTIKDRLAEALAATPPENSHRRDILSAALNAGETEAEIEAALARLIEAREQKAVALEKTGQAAQAKVERDEALALRRIADPEGSAATTSGKRPPLFGGKGGPVFTRLQIILAAAALVAVAVVLAIAFWPSPDNGLSHRQRSAPITVFQDDHTMGDPKAPITLIEYAAPTCPHCALFALTELPALKREFIDTGRVFYIFRVYPLGSPDGAVEGIARCLPKTRYFPYIEMMFREQPQWDPDGYQIPDVEGAIIKLAGREGLSPERAKSCMYDQTNRERINEMAQDALIHYQIEGTPTFVMNGQVVNFPPESQSRLEVLRLRINSLGANPSP